MHLGAAPVTARMLARKQPFIQRVRNSSLVEGPCVDNNRVLNFQPKPWGTLVPVGEHSGDLEARGTTSGGVSGKANVGISNDKEGEMPSRR